MLFQDLFESPLVATIEQQHASPDGGAVLLKSADRRYDLIDGFAPYLVDERQPGTVWHTLEDLLVQRFFGLASQPTIAGCENRVGSRSSTRWGANWSRA